MLLEPGICIKIVNFSKLHMMAVDLLDDIEDDYYMRFLGINFTVVVLIYGFKLVYCCSSCIGQHMYINGLTYIYALKSFGHRVNKGIYKYMLDNF